RQGRVDPGCDAVGRLPDRRRALDPAPPAGLDPGRRSGVLGPRRRRRVPRRAVRARLPDDQPPAVPGHRGHRPHRPHLQHARVGARPRDPQGRGPRDAVDRPVVGHGPRRGPARRRLTRHRIPSATPRAAGPAGRLPGLPAGRLARRPGPDKETTAVTRTARRRSSLRPGALALLVVAALAAACGSPPERSDSGADIVRIGLSPYFEYQPWVIADELGLDEQQGIDLQFTSIESTQTAAVAARRGDIDLVPSCHSFAFPFYKEIPELRDFMI